METVDVHEVIRQAVSVVFAQMQEKRIVLTVDLAARECWVFGDPVRLQQVFWNVLKNAVKFNTPGGAITVRTSNEGSEHTLRIEISDTGIGMTTGELERVFKPFCQGEQVEGACDRYRFGGLGLGMSISQALVKLHHGRISASSAGRGKGAAFFIELPSITPGIEAVPVGVSLPREQHEGDHGRRILLVEDHGPTRAILTRLLRRNDYEVTEAECLDAARKQAQADHFDLILSDIGLPDGSGYELMAELRAQGDTTPAIALSGYGMDADIQRSKETGFAEHLTKPVDFGALERAIQKVGECERP